MDFSIILASRQRSQLLVGLLKSINETAHDISKVEVLVGIDNDDAESQDCAINTSKWCPFVKYLSRDRSSMLNRDYINWVYDTAGSGKYAIVCNDDAAFRTKDWDLIANRKLDSYLADKPDGIVYGYISDALIDRQGMAYCCFPLVSRAGIKALGFAMPPEFPAWSADIELWKLYATVNRICDLSEVMIEHIAYHSGKRERDSVSYHVQEISNRARVGMPFHEYLGRLQNAINQGGKCLM